MLEIKLYCTVAASAVRRGLQFHRRGWGCSAAHHTDAGRLSGLAGIQFLIGDYTADAHNQLVQPFGDPSLAISRLNSSAAGVGPTVLPRTIQRCAEGKIAQAIGQADVGGGPTGVAIRIPGRFGYEGE